MPLRGLPAGARSRRLVLPTCAGVARAGEDAEHGREKHGKEAKPGSQVLGGGGQAKHGIYDINREQDCVKNSEGILGENELRPPSQLHSVSEKIETGSLSEKIFETVSLSSDSLFQRAVSLLHTSYLDSSSEHGFQYSHVTLVKNDIFLNEAKLVCQRGLRVGSSAVTTLGDPAKGKSQVCV